VLPLTWRWQQLLAARGVHERYGWLLRTSFTSIAFAQVLPTSLGGDATRIFAASRRHRGSASAVTGSVLLERVLGGFATLLLAAVGFLLAIGRYDVGAYLWIEGAFVLGTFLLAFLFFSRSARPLLRLSAPVLARVRLERPVRAVYDGVHAFRERTGLLVGLFAFTVAIQTVRVLAIWAAGRAVGIDLSPRIYYVMGPLFFLVLLVPFTLNGFAVREAFFVSFLGGVGVDADAAFAAGFLFFLVTVALALPGGGILLWEGLRGKPTPTHA
jgi:uncharacterized protein (TIRG00374 family)